MFKQRVEKLLKKLRSYIHDAQNDLDEMHKKIQQYKMMPLFYKKPVQTINILLTRKKITIATELIANILELYTDWNTPTNEINLLLGTVYPERLSIKQFAEGILCYLLKAKEENKTATDEQDKNSGSLGKLLETHYHIFSQLYPENVATISKDRYWKSKVG